MLSQRRPLVSFVIPTLNRGRYVVRAVESCLAADCDSVGVDIEVIVLDSESDDGSWEALQARFDADPRVRLVQNRRGLGPTRSWLDGARLVRGEYVTFVWSDDYISSNFLTSLLSSLQKGAVFSVGWGIIRLIDDDTLLPARNVHFGVPREYFLLGYVHRLTSDRIKRPVSPGCSLFVRKTFDSWVAITEKWCQATPIRHRLMWRRAIGPDLLLYLVALSENSGVVPIVDGATAQFSMHSLSITSMANRWDYETGYWLAKLWLIADDGFGPTLSPSQFRSYAGSLLGFGVTLLVLAVVESSSERFFRVKVVVDEMCKIWRAARTRKKILSLIIYSAWESSRLLFLITKMYLSSHRLSAKT